jgi:hypothetical protein
MKINELIRQLQEIEKRQSTSEHPNEVMIWSLGKNVDDYDSYDIIDISCENETAYIKIEKEEF